MPCVPWGFLYISHSMQSVITITVKYHIRMRFNQWKLILTLDGKQARRTSSSSPLGELFDHGCDSISTVMVAVSTCVSVQFGSHPTMMFIEVFAVYALFYCAHWQVSIKTKIHFFFFNFFKTKFSRLMYQERFILGRLM